MSRRPLLALLTAFLLGAVPPIPGALGGDVVVIEADLSLFSTDSPDPVTGGFNVLYEVTITNEGPDKATNITLVDTIPEGTALVSAGIEKGTCEPEGGEVICTLDVLRASRSRTASIVVETLNNDIVITNEAEVLPNEGEFDPDPDNNKTEEETLVEEDTGDGDAVGFVPDGGRFRNKADGGPPTEDFPEVVRVNLPDGVSGVIELAIEPGGRRVCPDDADPFGPKIDLTSPSSGPGSPIRFAFVEDASQVPGGIDASDVVLCHDGDLVPRVEDRSEPEPDPSMARARITKNGDLRTKVFTTENGKWRRS